MAQERRRSPRVLLVAKQARKPGQDHSDSRSVSSLWRWMCTPVCCYTQFTSWLCPHVVWGALRWCWVVLGGAGWC
ncbi:hypothetical protein T484DRAFT_1922279 [Baffinella frigidus]|nr:hypothetical protein T484DRAFT_1922279 [Cryptophyta sp. CCMP2293]